MAYKFKPAEATKENKAPKDKKSDTKMSWRQPGPSSTTIEATRGSKPLSQDEIQQRKEAGVSLTYRGDPTVPSNYSANITDGQNTSVWITGFPEGTTYPYLMKLLEGRGKIFAANISKPTHGFFTAAASVQFFRHVDAENVLNAINNGTLPARASGSDGGVAAAAAATTTTADVGHHQSKRTMTSATGRGGNMFLALAGEDDADDTSVVSSASFASRNTIASTATVQSSDNLGFRLHACWNRVKAAEPQMRAVNTRREDGRLQMPSRVIHVSGSFEEVKPAALKAYFTSKFRYNIDQIIYHGIAKNGSSEYEYRFASWKNQAEFAAMALRREKPMIRYWYGLDPCEVVEDDTDDTPALSDNVTSVTDRMQRNWRLE